MSRSVGYPCGRQTGLGLARVRPFHAISRRAILTYIAQLDRLRGRPIGGLERGEVICHVKSRLVPVA
jgi:hypothetical protein